ncbi:MAG: hypothetical protein V1723_04135 [Candidatus Uhrbacteria bacterium]
MSIFKEIDDMTENEAEGLLVRGVTAAQAAAALIAEGFDRRTAWSAVMTAQVLLAIGL